MQSILKAKLQVKNMVCVWWDHSGVICFEFSSHNQALIADLLTKAATSV